MFSPIEGPCFEDNDNDQPILSDFEGLKSKDVLASTTGKWLPFFFFFFPAGTLAPPVPRTAISL